MTNTQRRRQFQFIKVTLALISCLAICAGLSAEEIVVDFEDVGSNLGSEGFYNGSDGAGGFDSGPLSFNNTHGFSFGFEFWSGWSYSNQTDTTTAGFENQYSNIVGQGDANSATYAVAFGDTAEINSSFGTIQSFAITNTTFAALSIRDGDQFAKQFGGPSGNDPDFFSVDILSLDESGNELDSQTVFLADFRFDDNSQDFILTDWQTVDVSGLNANRIGFRFAGSDVGPFGLNTPSYFALDTVVVAVPEPGTWLALGIIATYGYSRRRKTQ